jgi:hypothetical protein
MGTAGSFPGESGRGMKLTTHLHLVPRLKNEWSYTSTPQYAFMGWCSVKEQGRLHLTSYYLSSVWFFFFFLLSILTLL